MTLKVAILSWIIWMGPIQSQVLLEVGRSLLYTQRRRQYEDTAERVFKCISTVFENVGNNPLIKKCKVQL